MVEYDYVSVGKQTSVNAPSRTLLDSFEQCISVSPCLVEGVLHFLAVAEPYPATKLWGSSFNFD